MCPSTHFGRIATLIGLEIDFAPIFPLSIGFGFSLRIEMLTSSETIKKFLTKTFDKNFFLCFFFLYGEFDYRINFSSIFFFFYIFFLHIFFECLKIIKNSFEVRKYFDKKTDFPAQKAQKKNLIKNLLIIFEEVEISIKKESKTKI